MRCNLDTLTLCGIKPFLVQRGSFQGGARCVAVLNAEPEFVNLDWRKAAILAAGAKVVAVNDAISAAASRSMPTVVLGGHQLTPCAPHRLTIPGGVFKPVSRVGQG